MSEESQQQGCQGVALRGMIWGAGFMLLLLLVGAVYQALASNADRRNHPPAGQMVSVGEYQLHLYCTGSGSPTVILVPGSGNMYAHWDLVQRETSSFTRVCSYDRAGTGWSDMPGGAPTMQQHVSDLHTLLATAVDDSPYILVGHSMGGIQVREYVTAYPDDVRGVVLVDSSIEGQYNDLPDRIRESNQAASLIWLGCQAVAPFGIVRLLGLGNAFANAFDNYSKAATTAIATTFHQTGTCRGLSWESAIADNLLASGEPDTLGDVPLLILTRGLNQMEANPGDYPPEQQQVFREMYRVWQEIQANLTTLSTNSRQIIAEDSGHFIQNDQPGLVVDAIQQVIEMSADAS